MLGPLQSAVLGQRGFLFPWSPVFLAIGIGGYFALKQEPAITSLWLAGLFGLGCILWQRRLGATWGPMLLALGLTALGFSLAGNRAHQVAGPVLDFRYYGAIEGRIVGIDRSASDAVRLTLDEVVLERMSPAKTPHRVRISLHGEQGFIDPKPGARIILTGHLSAPNGAVEPGGFDFRRHAWFLGLGAVGYTRTPVLLLQEAGRGQSVFKIRMRYSAHVQRMIPGEAGAFAAAVTTGDRSGMGQGTLQALRDTNLAHLLAISGLHMGLLAGFVFGALRLVLLALPATRHRRATKKIAAAAALMAASGYLALSGGNVATERAFVMVAVALCAVVLDRRALSLRAVAIAALIILCWQPEALLGPGFQMSFAATTALVAVFEKISKMRGQRRAPRWSVPFVSLVVSSAVAGLATAPIGMAHFNQIAHFGLIANLVSVPIMGLVVVPMAVLAALLLPFGLDWMPLALMKLGLEWILWVAQTVAQWDGAVGTIVAPGPLVLPLLALGALFTALWQGRLRVVGALPIALAAVLWAQTDRPDILISANGALVGVMTDQGRALSKEKGAGFVAQNWLENDGFGGDQALAAALWKDRPAPRRAQVSLGPWSLVHLQGKRAVAAYQGCEGEQILVASVAFELKGACRVFDPSRLKQSGAVALWLSDGQLRIKTAASVSGRRLWNGADPRPIAFAWAVPAVRAGTAPDQ
ncbi:ComEC/Rec2 family competence protein [Thalassococcus lentus]|uniref:ComEC/Rec2 family competence protein n=1 Tax=Thalassococcus lentus TaxID=1210524 RepID=A0ABT4XRJ5_9RHOB|nr:ComEC/Rec2 family competence protein [Thalassococcus lentus]MDA7424569.1 ComEC/Rec2 family competence protein [Thalassococcus lentus]